MPPCRPAQVNDSRPEDVHGGAVVVKNLEAFFIIGALGRSATSAWLLRASTRTARSLVRCSQRFGIVPVASSRPEGPAHGSLVW